MVVVAIISSSRNIIIYLYIYIYIYTYIYIYIYQQPVAGVHRDHRQDAQLGKHHRLDLCYIV